MRYFLDPMSWQVSCSNPFELDNRLDFETDWKSRGASISVQ